MTNTNMSHRSGFFLATALAFVACGPSTPSTPSIVESDGAVLARVGETPITAAAFQKRLTEAGPAVAARYASPERRKEYLENMIRDEVLVQEAKRRGLDRSAAVAEATRRAMIQEVLKTPAEEASAKAGPTDEELRQYYDAHLAEFVYPSRVRVYRLLVEASRTDVRARASARRQAQALLTEIQTKERSGETDAFQAAAKQSSADGQSAGQGGDLRFLTREELASFYSAELATAAMALGIPGEQSGLVETPQGFELLKLQAKTQGSEKTFEEARDLIRDRLTREHRSLNFDGFVKKLRADGKVVVNDAALEKIELAPQAH